VVTFSKHGTGAALDKMQVKGNLMDSHSKRGRLLELGRYTFPRGEKGARCGVPR
jgi:hypothetical protein